MGMQDTTKGQNYEKFENDEAPMEAKEEKPATNHKCAPQDGFKLIVAGCILFALSLTAGVVVDTFLRKAPTGHGGVASDSQECSNIGISILHDGGTAVDAAIATMLCLTVTRPSSTGLTSGGYMLLHTPNGKDVTIDFQFVAPNSASEDMFGKDKSKSVTGALSFAIPGLLKGLKLAHKDYGKLPWSNLLEPAIGIAKSGFKVNQDLVDSISNALTGASADFKKVFTPSGKIPKVGDTLKLEKLALVLDGVAKNGEEAFYSGNTAKEILDTVISNGGNLTASDLNNYTALETGVYSQDFGDYKIISTPPPSSGTVVLAAMNLIHRLGLQQANQDKALNYHYLAEVFKFVFAERSKLGDPHFNKDVKDVVTQMLSKKMADELSKKISFNKTYPASYYGPFFSTAATKGTANVVVLGNNGDLVSVVSTIGGSFGSKLVTKSGIVLNNGMSSFSSPGFNDRDGIPPSKANYIEPGKRPLSAASPVIAFNKKKPCSDQYIVGSSGGAKAITATIQVLVDLLHYRLSGEDAVKRPRIHTQLTPDAVLAEGKKFHKAGIDSVLSKLKAMGYKMDNSAERLGTINVISQQKKFISTYADERKSGGSAKF
eukprot:gene8506-14506_t